MNEQLLKLEREREETSSAFCRNECMYICWTFEFNIMGTGSVCDSTVRTSKTELD